DLLGIERFHLLGQRFGLYVADEVRLFFADFLEKVFAGQVKESCEVTLTRDRHSPLFVRIEAVALVSGLECLVAVIDITKRKQVEEALLLSEQQFRTLADAIPHLCWMANADGGIFWYNQRWYDFTGTTPEQMYGWGWQSVHDPKVLPQVIEQWKASIANGKPFEMVLPLRGSDGVFRTFLTRGMPVCDQDGKVVRWFGTNTDISEQKRVEDALAEKQMKLEQLNKTLEVRISQAVDEMRRKDQAMIQQNSLAAMGEMIRNIAHQWRQPLNVVSMIIQSVQLKYESGTLTTEEMNSDVQGVMETILQMSQTIDDFRNFFQPNKVKRRFLISEAVNRAISLVSASLDSHNINVEIKTDDDVTVVGYQNEYSQVLLNILSNSCEACIEQSVADPRIFIRIAQENERSVLYIRDNCGGIPDDVILKIFDPYFTTRSPDKGTGIGLYMSKMIIEQNMGGHLTASNVAGGAEFRIEV
ncbi:MAG: sensor histidine kinase, partial [Acidobacteria bacterium]|nr:sensor histidine kinase [Acidobacteriota bacterium]